MFPETTAPTFRDTQEFWEHPEIFNTNWAAAGGALGPGGETGPVQTGQNGCGCEMFALVHPGNPDGRISSTLLSIRLTLFSPSTIQHSPSGKDKKTSAASTN